LLQPFGQVPVLEDGDLTLFGKFIFFRDHAISLRRKSLWYKTTKCGLECEQYATAATRPLHLEHDRSKQSNKGSSEGENYKTELHGG
jgi:hypothetical protein